MNNNNGNVFFLVRLHVFVKGKVPHLSDSNIKDGMSLPLSNVEIRKTGSRSGKGDKGRRQSPSYQMTIKKGGDVSLYDIPSLKNILLVGDRRRQSQ
jgi:hypothetical protein